MNRDKCPRVTGSDTSVIGQRDADHYEQIAEVPTGFRTNTSLYLASLNRLYLAVSLGRCAHIPPQVMEALAIALRGDASQIDFRGNLIILDHKKSAAFQLILDLARVRNLDATRFTF